MGESLITRRSGAYDKFDVITGNTLSSQTTVTKTSYSAHVTVKNLDLNANDYILTLVFYYSGGIYQATFAFTANGVAEFNNWNTGGQAVATVSSYTNNEIKFYFRYPVEVQTEESIVIALS